jgi:hypothetical protein
LGSASPEPATAVACVGQESARQRVRDRTSGPRLAPPSAAGPRAAVASPPGSTGEPAKLAAVFDRRERHERPDNDARLDCDVTDEPVLVGDGVLRRRVEHATGHHHAAGSVRGVRPLEELLENLRVVDGRERDALRRRRVTRVQRSAPMKDLEEVKAHDRANRIVDVAGVDHRPDRPQSFERAGRLIRAAPPPLDEPQAFGEQRRPVAIWRSRRSGRRLCSRTRSG